MKAFAKKILSDVPIGSEFILHKRGLRKVKNLMDLRAELEQMPEEEYFHHVNSHKNDFSVWVENAVEDEKLAKDMLGITSKEEIIELLTSRIDFAISVLEKENDKIINEELTRLKEIETKSKNVGITKTLNSLEKNIRKLSKNFNYEKKILDHDKDLRILDWKTFNPQHPNARVIEFLFGLVTGLILGLILARAVIS